MAPLELVRIDWNHRPWLWVDSSLSGTAARVSGEKTSEVDGPGAP